MIPTRFSRKEDELWQDHLVAEAAAVAAPVPSEVLIAAEAVPLADSMQVPAADLPAGLVPEEAAVAVIGAVRDIMAEVFRPDRRDQAMDDPITGEATAVLSLSITVAGFLPVPVAAADA